MGCARVAAWNGTAWSAYGNGTAFGGYVSEVVALPNGDVAVGGFFATIGNVTCRSVARWDGMTWFPIGGGFDGPVKDLLQTQSHGLIALGGVSGYGVNRWDGTNWLPIGYGVGGAEVLASLPNGEVVVGGTVTTPNPVIGQPPVVCNIARSTLASSWQTLGGGTHGSVWALATKPNGHLVAGGRFTIAGTAACNRVALWDGRSPCAAAAACG